MLVIRRKVGEVIVVKIGGEELEIHVKDMKAGTVGLCFKGPLCFNIVRKELINGSSNSSKS